VGWLWMMNLGDAVVTYLRCEHDSGLGVLKKFTMNLSPHSRSMAGIRSVSLWNACQTHSTCAVVFVSKVRYRRNLCTVIIVFLSFSKCIFVLSTCTNAKDLVLTRNAWTQVPLIVFCIGVSLFPLICSFPFIVILLYPYSLLTSDKFIIS
jgi:sorbitol-specific phosphotransferase system component IIBC